MEAQILSSLPPNSAFFLGTKPPRISTQACSPPFTRHCRIRAINTENSNDSNQNPSPPTSPSPPLPPQPSPTAAAEVPKTVEIRYRRGSRRRAKQQQDGSFRSNASPTNPKDWDSMTMNEKMADLYMGEKGLLFWLNKFAYASIFIVIGGWILFRFVGPSIGLYQLDAPPLSPSTLFKGSE